MTSLWLFDADFSGHFGTNQPARSTACSAEKTAEEREPGMFGYSLCTINDALCHCHVASLASHMLLKLNDDTHMV